MRFCRTGTVRFIEERRGEFQVTCICKVLAVSSSGYYAWRQWPPSAREMASGLGTLLVYQYAQMCGSGRVVYASSGCSIYGSSAPLPLKEDFMSMHLTTPYQITKMLGELYGNFFYHHYGLPVVKTRFFNSYGEWGV